MNMAKFTLQESNFPSKTPGVMVPWVIFLEGESSGLKKSKSDSGEWVPACAPKTIIALLEAENKDEIIAVCKAAIAKATPAPAPVKTVAPPPPAKDETKYFHFDGDTITSDANGAVQMSALHATNLSIVNENALFCKVGTEDWMTAKQLGLVKVAVLPPPPPVRKPMAPQPPAVPVNVENLSVVSEDVEAPVTMATPAIDARSAVDRILAKRNAS
jgi:hypothetical protein